MGDADRPHNIDALCCSAPVYRRQIELDRSDIWFDAVHMQLGQRLVKRVEEPKQFLHLVHVCVRHQGIGGHPIDALMREDLVPDLAVPGLVDLAPMAYGLSHAAYVIHRKIIFATGVCRGVFATH